MRVVSHRHRDASTAADLACYSVIRAILRAQEADDDLHAARPDIERVIRELIDHFGPGVTTELVGSLGLKALAAVRHDADQSGVNPVDKIDEEEQRILSIRAEHGPDPSGL
jgi:hypothetical protein